MKSIKKLIMASLMLVLAFVGVVASTFAWFTMQNQVNVDQLEMSVSEAGNDLQISSDGILFDYRVSVSVPTGELVPVTLMDDDWSTAPILFNSLVLNPETSKYEYAPASPITSAEGSTGYFQFNLWFRSEEAITVKFNVTDFDAYLQANIGLDPQDAEIIKTLRIMFVEVDQDDSDAYVSHVIYEPWYDEESTYGNGDFFSSLNPYISGAFSDFVDGPVSDVYTLKAAHAGEYTALNLDSVAGVDAPTEPEVLPVADQTDLYINIATTEEGNVAGTKVVVYIWVEGWDGDTTNNAALSAIKAYLKFIGE